MSCNEEDYSSEDDGDYIPEDHSNSESEDENDSHENNQNCKINSDDNVDKTKVDEIWQSFRNDLKNDKKLCETTKENDTAEPTSSSKIDDCNPKTESDCKAETKREIASSSKNNSATGEVAALPEKDTVTITKVYDFAGEEVKVTKEVKRDSMEAQIHLKSQAPTKPTGFGKVGALHKRPGGGLGSVLGKLGKKPKLSTLEKSKLDWDQYKEEEGIQEELQNYNKGKEGYLEKVSFLERTEMREFYKERDMRLNKTGMKR
ncbi:unnamed protein product [Clavelina lepadiformis]|uniref:Craniofacial development protein 1 n=1 Tax=Clavelina lepadiformis TaxID=159417 RepID=A0ABP0FSU5_CLALP